MADPGALKALIFDRAGELGFVRVGIALAAPSARAERFRRFLALGYHADMAYLARDPSRRCDAGSALDGAVSVICLAISYAPAPGDDPDDAVARYARGRDYHRVLRGRCRRLVAELRKAQPDVRARICVDTAPLLERDLAAAAGLGWIGRNGCLIDHRLGSYLLLGEILTNLPLPPDQPAKARCGSCRACIDACLTGAITEFGLVDSRRCISYLTIEHRGQIPPQLRAAMGRRIFGCDLCQEVCPFNRRAAAGDAELRGGSAGLGSGHAGHGRPAGEIRDVPSQRGHCCGQRRRSGLAGIAGGALPSRLAAGGRRRPLGAGAALRSPPTGDGRGGLT